MEVDLGLVAEILTIVLALLSTFLGLKYKKAKQIMKEVAEALNETYKSIEDNKVTEDELKRAIKEWVDVLEAWRGLL